MRNSEYIETALGNQTLAKLKQYRQLEENMRSREDIETNIRNCKSDIAFYEHVLNEYENELEDLDKPKILQSAWTACAVDPLNSNRVVIALGCYNEYGPQSGAGFDPSQYVSNWDGTNHGVVFNSKIPSVSLTVAQTRKLIENLQVCLGKVEN
jgi:hypothetical protein